MLCLNARPQNRNLRNLTAHHRHFITTIKSWAVLAILEYLIGQRRALLDLAKSVAEKESWNACEQAHAAYAMHFRFFKQRRQNSTARAVPLRFRAHHDRPYLHKMRSVKMQSAASQKHSSVGFGHGEISNVLANLRKRAPQQRSVMRQAVHQLVNIRRILKARFTHLHGPPRIGV